MSNALANGRRWITPRVEVIALAALVLASLFLAYRMTRPLLFVLAAAAASSSLCSGLFRRLSRRLRGRRRLAAISMVIVLFVGVLGPVLTLGTWASRRVVLEAVDIVTTLRNGDTALIEQTLQRAGPLRPIAEPILRTVVPKLAGWAPSLAQAATHSLSVLGHAAVRLAVGGFLFAVAFYYFLLRGRSWANRMISIVPLPEEDVRLFLTRFRQTAAGILIGNVGTAATQALVATGGYLIFGAPAPLLFGAATFGAALIPLVGPALVWLPLAAWIGFGKSALAGVGLALFGALIISTVDNFIRPVLMRRGLPLHPLLLFIAVFGGIATYGFAGVFFGPFVMALAMTSIELWEERVNRSKPESGGGGR
jgi:predicted PurR-regulated permease PerM